jgi:Na+-transporting methylmalonyl-CoA/oxaloacetate decarboxylase beta subunit
MYINKRGNKMRIRKKIIINIFLKIFFVFIIIMLNYFFVKHNKIAISENTSVEIIGGTDGSTTIYIFLKYILINILRYSLSLFFIIGIVTLLIYDIINIKNDKKYSIKYKFKTVLTVYLFIIISTIIEITFNLLGPMISVILNIIIPFYSLLDPISPA